MSSVPALFLFKEANHAILVVFAPVGAAYFPNSRPSNPARVHSGLVQPTGIGVWLRPDQFCPGPVGLPANRLRHRIQSHGAGGNPAAHLAFSVCRDRRRPLRPSPGHGSRGCRRRAEYAGRHRAHGHRPPRNLASVRRHIVERGFQQLPVACLFSRHGPTGTQRTAWPRERPGQHRPRRQ